MDRRERERNKFKHLVCSPLPAPLVVIKLWLTESFLNPWIYVSQENTRIRSVVCVFLLHFRIVPLRNQKSPHQQSENSPPYRAVHYQRCHIVPWIHSENLFRCTIRNCLRLHLHQRQAFFCSYRSTECNGWHSPMDIPLAHCFDLSVAIVPCYCYFLRCCAR